MNYNYADLKALNGRTCFTLTQNKPALMSIDDEKVVIDYPSGNTRLIPRSMMEEALRILNMRGILTLEDVHEGITRRQGPLTDRLLAVLRELPGVSFNATPRMIYKQNR